MAGRCRRCFAGVEHACMHRICFRKTDSAPLCCTGPAWSICWLAGWPGVRAYITKRRVFGERGRDRERERAYATRGFQTSRSLRSSTFVMQYVSVYQTGPRLSLRFTLTLRVQEVLIKREINRIRFH